MQRRKYCFSTSSPTTCESVVMDVQVQSRVIGGLGQVKLSCDRKDKHFYGQYRKKGCMVSLACPVIVFLYVPSRGPFWCCVTHANRITTHKCTPFWDCVFPCIFTWSQSFWHNIEYSNEEAECEVTFRVRKNSDSYEHIRLIIEKNRSQSDMV